MSTDIRPEISKQSPYWISRHRFYELKHFCLQYKEWKEDLQVISCCGRNPLDGQEHSRSGSISDPVFDCVLKRELLSDHVDMVNKAAKACSDEIGNYIFKGVTEGLSWEQQFLQNGIPCGKDMYYEAFRRFFWVLSRMRK